MAGGDKWKLVVDIYSLCLRNSQLKQSASTIISLFEGEKMDFHKSGEVPFDRFDELLESQEIDQDTRYPPMLRAAEILKSNGVVSKLPEAIAALDDKQRKSLLADCAPSEKARARTIDPSLALAAQTRAVEDTEPPVNLGSKADKSRNITIGLSVLCLLLSAGMYFIFLSGDLPGANYQNPPIEETIEGMFGPEANISYDGATITVTNAPAVYAGPEAAQLVEPILFEMWATKKWQTLSVTVQGSAKAKTFEAANTMPDPNDMGAEMPTP